MGKKTNRSKVIALVLTGVLLFTGLAEKIILKKLENGVNENVSETNTK